MDAGKLFSDIKFIIAQCNDVDDIRTKLIEGGAKHINYLSEHVTLVIADTNCPEAEEAIELYDKPVVKSLWVHLSLKANKLLPTEAFSPMRTIFQHVIASFSSDLSQNDIETLASTLTFYGARVCKQVDKATHLIVASAESNEIAHSKTQVDNQLKIVAPDWVLESVKQNCCCDEQLYDPSLLLPPLPPTPSPPQLVTNADEEATQSQTNASDSSNKSKVEGPTQPTSEQQSQHPPQYRGQVSVPTRGPAPANVTQMRPQMQPQVTAQVQPHHQPQSQSQINPMQPQIQSHPTQLPRPRLPNVIRGGLQPRFRPILPPSTNVPIIQRSAISQQPRVLAPETQQPKKVTISYGQYRKPVPYQNNLDPQQQMHIQPQSPYTHVSNQQPAGNMIQPTRLPQPNMYHQVRGTYQNSHVPQRGPPQQSMLNAQQQQVHQQPQQQQQQSQMINRFQDPNHMGVAQRPYQVCLQPQQPVNPNYHQSNVQRQPIYYSQNPNQIPMRMQSPPVRHIQGEQVVYDNFNQPHHSQDPTVISQQQHYQSQPIQQALPQTHQHQQMQPSQQQHQQPSAIPARPQFQVNPSAQCPSPQTIRPVRSVFNNQQEPSVRLPRHPNSYQVSGQQIKVPINNQQQPQPHPSIFDHQQETLALIKAKVPVVTETINYYGHDPKENVPKNLPFSGCVFKIIDYDEISAKEKEEWCDVIRDAGGAFNENIEVTTHLICENRFSSQFTEALKLGVRCVTVYWINDVLRDNHMSYPTKALHLPVPFSKDKKPLTGQIVAVTNLKGRQRQEVREMLLNAGAKITDYFSPTNTMIICGNVGGDKYERAVEWKIPIVNCRLVSDILLNKDRDLNAMLMQSKYQIFNRTDPLKLSSYLEVRDIMNPWTKPLKINNKKEESKTSTLNGGKTASIAAPISSDDSGIATSGSNNSDLDATNGKIQLSDKTTSLNGQPEDNENEKSEQLPKMEGDLLKDQIGSHELCDEKNIKPSVKILRKSTEPVRILFTNLDPPLVKQLESHALELGLGFANGPTNCTHLIVDCISRTPKFICAFSHAKYIISHKWLIESHEESNLLDEKIFLLQDPEGEEKYSFNLVHSLMKRRKRVRLLFNNHVFFVTPTVLSTVANLKEMIESAGGVIATKKLPNKMQLHHMRTEGKRLVAVTCDQDFHLCSTLMSNGVDIVTVEFVISGILRQDIDFEAHRIKTNNVPFIRPETTQISDLSPPKKMKLDDSLC